MSAENKISDNKKLLSLKRSLILPSDLPEAAAGLVHEVKNPLAAIHLHLQLLEGYVGEIEEKKLRAKVENKVTYIKKEIQNLNQSLHDFIALIRAEKKSQPVTVDLIGLVEDVVKFLEPQALREGIAIEFRAEESPEEIQMDGTFIKQIVMNLVINSIQAFEKSDIPLEKRKIIVSAGTRQESIFLSVADNGPGIPADIQEQIFEPFFSMREKGTGLGLSIVKRMVANAGGHLELHTEPGHGTEFRIIFERKELSA